MNYPRYPEYKPSGVEWLGEVPAHWTVTQLKRKFAVQLGKMLQNEASSADHSLEKYLRAANIQWEGVDLSDVKEMWFSPADKQKFRLASGDLLVSEGGDIGRASLWNGEQDEMYIQNAINRVRSRKGDSTRFLYYWMRVLKQLGYIDILCNKATIAHYTAEKVGWTEIVLPSLDEQRAIAAFLDRETARIDALIARKQRLIELLAEKRTALISQTVTKGLTNSPGANLNAGACDGGPKGERRDSASKPDAPTKDSGVEWLGEIPAHWATPPLYARYAVELGKMLNEGRITGNHLVPYLRNVDVQWDAIRFDDLPGMDIPVSEYQRYTIRKGDLLVCEGGEVGRAAIVGEIDSIVGYQKALHRLRAKSSDETSRFMYYTLFWAANSGVFNIGGVSTIAHLTGEQLRRYRFPKPPAQEQRDIVDYLDRESSRLDTLRAKIESAIERLKEYRAALIADAVTGKIDVRSFAKQREVA